MQKEIFFTDRRNANYSCLLEHNAPIPYDQGEGAKELKVLQEKSAPSNIKKGVEKF